MLDKLSYQVKLSAPYDQALETVKTALKKEGFGVLTSVDVQATLKEKLDADFRRYTILGACNPSSAYQALQSEPLVGLLLPCNVTVEETEDGSLVSLINPEALLAGGQIAMNEEVGEVARDARTRLERVVAALEA